MHNIVSISGENRRYQGMELDPRSRVALIMANVERLAEEANSVGSSATSAEFVRRVIAARAARSRYFSDDLFADPAWDILLELYALRCAQQRISVSKLCLAARVPPTTALRWIDKLDSEGLVDREADPLDARRVWVSLSDRGNDAMSAYVEGIAGSALL